MGEYTKAVNDQSFEAEVLKETGTVLVDFWAQWCGPCRAIGPSLEELAKDKQGSLKVVKVDIDENPMSPTKYGVRSIPTLLIFKNGQIVDQRVGGLPKSELYKWVESKIA